MTNAPPSAAQNPVVVLLLCHAWKCVPTFISSGVDIPEVPGCHALQKMSSQRGSRKLLQEYLSHPLTAYLSISYTFLNSVKYHQKQVNQVTLNHATL